jgi:TetR/AcrR family transcriptional repressor of nem operon
MQRRAAGTGDDTAARILDVAERLVQERGFNAFSYAHVAGELGITTASLHYHFPGKAQLGEALIKRYAQRFAEALARLDSEGLDGPRTLAGYADLYAQTLRDHRMCLCGMLAADYATLSPPIRQEVRSFLDHNERWLTGVLERGRDAGTLRFHGPADESARMLIGGLEGALLVARPYGDPKRFQSMATLLLASVNASPADRAAAGTIR